MAQENKQLLLTDLCVRLPYKTMVKCITDYRHEFDEELSVIHIMNFYQWDTKPYLRPMSSMTEEERKEFSKLLVKRYCEEDWEGHISTSYCIEIDNVYTDDEDGIKYPSAFSIDAIDWLNAHHFDYRGLIEKGLAIEAPEGMYDLKKK